MESSTSRFCGLPPELRLLVLSFLPNADLKSLRLVSSAHVAVVKLRFDRVFLSANSTNIRVFREIANHELLRHDVVEIVWDDARFPPNSRLGWRQRDLSSSEGQTVPRWFERAHIKNMIDFNSRIIYDVAFPRHVRRRAQFTSSFTLEDSWAYYKGLLDDQSRVVASDTDFEAFEYGLQCFPNLQRITVTPLAHGVLFAPIYETPMIRAFPYGFAYPIPRGWPCNDIFDNFRRYALPWDGGDEQYTFGFEQGLGAEGYRELWRGYRAATRILARGNYAIQELVMESRMLYTGISGPMFACPNPDYEHFKKVLAQPSLRRLDLPLFIDGEESDAFPSLRSGLLRDALAGASGLESLSLFSSVEMATAGVATEIGDDGPVANFVPLASVVPIECWPRLHHFALSGFVVLQSDLVSFLETLPPSVRTVQLNLLMFLDGGNCRDLLIDMRDRLHWRHRPEAQRPVLTMICPHSTIVMARRIWANASVNRFLYEDGPNPFSVEEMQDPNEIAPGSFGFECDEFDPFHKRPYDSASKMKELGYYNRGNGLRLPIDDKGFEDE